MPILILIFANNKRNETKKKKIRTLWQHRLWCAMHAHILWESFWVTETSITIWGIEKRKNRNKTKQKNKQKKGKNKSKQQENDENF